LRLRTGGVELPLAWLLSLVVVALIS